MTKDTITLIPVHNGFNPVNGLPVQSVSCVVYNAKTLEILATEPTNNKAEERANTIYVESGRTIDARADMLRYGGGPLLLVGMKMEQFQCFKE